MKLKKYLFNALVFLAISLTYVQTLSGAASGNLERTAYGLSMGFSWILIHVLSNELDRTTGILKDLVGMLDRIFKEVEKETNNKNQSKQNHQNR